MYIFKKIKAVEVQLEENMLEKIPRNMCEKNNGEKTFCSR